MPIYPYICENEKCENNGEIEDVFCSYGNRSKHSKCPKCNQERRQIICVPGMTVIHDCQGKADLYHKRVYVKGGQGFNATINNADNETKTNRYYWKNNPNEDPRIMKRRMESDGKKSK